MAPYVPAREAAAEGSGRLELDVLQVAGRVPYRDGLLDGRGRARLRTLHRLRASRFFRRDHELAQCLDVGSGLANTAEPEPVVLHAVRFGQDRLRVRLHRT